MPSGACEGCRAPRAARAKKDSVSDALRPGLSSGLGTRHSAHGTRALPAAVRPRTWRMSAVSIPMRPVGMTMVPIVSPYIRTPVVWAVQRDNRAAGQDRGSYYQSQPQGPARHWSSGRLGVAIGLCQAPQRHGTCAIGLRTDRRPAPGHIEVSAHHIRRAKSRLIHDANQRPAHCGLPLRTPLTVLRCSTSLAPALAFPPLIHARGRPTGGRLLAHLGYRRPGRAEGVPPGECP
jgi:hypothetical protein